MGEVTGGDVRVSRSTTHRRFTEWTQAGLWVRLHQQFLHRLGVVSEIDWSRVIADSISVRAEKGATRLTQIRLIAASQVRRSTYCVRPHRGTPDRTDLRSQRPRRSTADPTARLDRPGSRTTRPTRHRPAKLHADKAYDVRALRDEVRRRGIAVRIARKGVESSERLGRHRWVVESCLSWLQRNRRLVRRYERKAELFQAFTDMACALLAYHRLTKHHHLG